jgi:3'(2'), 5'-bisphosphate nucleotidase
MPSDWRIDLDHLLETALLAGAAILEVYAGDFEVERKADKSPLTEADLRAHRVITERLAERYPDVPILSEEAADECPFEVRQSWTRFWLVDPLDGTKEFVKRNGQFTVNIALIEDGRPVAGVVYAPVLDLLYYSDGAGGAFKVERGGEPVKLGNARKAHQGKFVIVGSLSHPTPEMDAYVEEQRAKHGEVEFLPMGSSLKICLVADGQADVYPRLGPTMEWDTAAAHAVATAAGRRVLRYDTRTDLLYNKENLLNSWFIVE